MRYIVILETPSFVHYLPGLFKNDEEIVCLMQGDFIPSGFSSKQIKICKDDPLQRDTYQRLEIHPDDRIILFADKKETLEALLNTVLSVCDSIPIVAVVSDTEKTAPLPPDNVSYLLTGELLHKNIEREWLYINDRKHTEKILNLTQGADNILILTQHDPDPDALASGLALRSLLGRNRATAPIGSFGKVTRSENLRMIQLLDIRYNIIDPQKLNSYSMIAMVDVQPPYFGERVPRADIVFDHHPQSAEYKCSFKDIRVQYGATSTILTQYLMAKDIKLKQRLATALFYGIKTDTLVLERGTNPADIEAFTCLFPLANHNLIRQMENPSLNPEEVNSFIRALKRQRLVEKVLFTHIGRVKKEDIIPRLADFCIQVAGAEWSVVSGLFQRNLVISIRNVGYVKSAAETVKKVFTDTSVAGGHRTMAKAVIPIRDFKKIFHIATNENKEIGNKIIELFLKAMKENE